MKTNVKILTLAGTPNKPNEDRAGAVGNTLWVIDGATGKGDREAYIGKDGETDAAWLARRIDELFNDKALSFGFDHAALIQNVHTLLSMEFNQNAFAVPEANYAFPSAGLTLVTYDQNKIKISALADCTTLLRCTDGTIIKQAGDPVLVANDTYSTEEMVRIRRDLPENEHHKMRHLILPTIRKNHSMANQPNGFGLFTLACPIPPYFVRSFDVPRQDIQDLCILSDGFYAVVEDYHALDDAGLMNALRHGEAEKVGQTIRAIEDQDPLGHTFPRLKKSDDATVLYLHLNA